MIRRPGSFVRPLLVAETIAQLNFRYAVMKQQPRVIGDWLCQRLVDLGPVYVKVGQFISTRADIFGSELSSELKGLRDKAKPMNRTDSDALIQLLLDRSQQQPDPIVHVDPVPIAAASIGQVHLGITRASRRIAVKLKRKNIEAQIQDERATMSAMLSLVSLVSPSTAERYQKQQRMLEDAVTTLLEEANFRQEAVNLKLYTSSLGGSRNRNGRLPVRLPELYEEYSCDAMLVMECLQSQSVAAHVAQLTDQQRLQLSNQVMFSFIEHAGLEGVLHGDPHAGNIGLGPCQSKAMEGDTCLMLYDFGSIVLLTPKERMLIKELIYTLISGDVDTILTTLNELQVTVTDEEGVRKYIAVYLDYIRTLDINVFKRNSDLFHRDGDSVELPIQFNGKLYHLIRVFGTLEGVCKSISKDFNYFNLIDSLIATVIMDEGFLMYKAQKDTESLLRGLGL